MDIGVETLDEFFGIAQFQGIFISVGSAGSIFTSSPDGTWRRRTSGSPEQLNCAAFGTNSCVVAGRNGTILQSDRISFPAVLQDPANVTAIRGERRGFALAAVCSG